MDIKKTIEDGIRLGMEFYRESDQNPNWYQALFPFAFALQRLYQTLPPDCEDRGLIDKAWERVSGMIIARPDIAREYILFCRSRTQDEQKRVDMAFRVAAGCGCRVSRLDYVNETVTVVDSQDNEHVVSWPRLGGNSDEI